MSQRVFSSTWNRSCVHIENFGSGFIGCLVKTALTGHDGRKWAASGLGGHWPALATCSSLLVAEIQDMSKSLPEGVFNPGQALANRPQLKRSSWFLRGFLDGFMVNSWKNSSGLKSFPNQKNGSRHHLPRIVLPSAAGLATASPLYGTLAHSTLAHITTASPLYGTLAHAVQHTPEYETQLPCLFLHRLGSGCCYSPIHLQQVASLNLHYNQPNAAVYNWQCTFPFLETKSSHKQ